MYVQCYYRGYFTILPEFGYKYSNFYWEMQVNSPESPLYQPTVFFPLEHFAKKGEEVRQLCLELCIDVPKCCT